MRWTLAVVLLLLPTGLAQSQVMEDGEDDAVATLAGGTAAPDGAAETGPYDLVGFFVEEDPRGFKFTVQVRDLAMDAGTFGSGAVHAQFQHADRTFRVSWYRFESFGVEYRGELSMYDGGRDGWSPIHRGPVAMDVAAGLLHFEAPREMLVDGNGTLPQAGRSFDRFQSFSQGSSQPFTGFGGSLQITDAMPDQGFGTPYAVVHGLLQTGHAHLASSSPVRASNGEKGIFVFHVEASNLAKDEARFALAPQNVPEGWDITLPAVTIRLDGNTTRSFPVLVSVPFKHVHGAFEAFTLEMTSQRDPDSVGRLQLGIRYLAIPQPAGHHDRVYFHSRTDAASPGFFGSVQEAPAVLYMNSLEEDDLDEGLPVAAQQGGGFGTSTWQWDVYLEPGLEMGLDFDRNRTGEIQARFDARDPVGIGAAVLRGQLLHLAGERAPDGTLRGARTTVLADLVPSSPTSVGGDTLLTATVQPTPDSDLVPYGPDVALLLRLRLEGESTNFGFTSDTRPAVLGGEMQLPLNEYRDPVENVLNALAGLSFRHDSAAERKVNPGDTVLFNLTLRNDGAVDDTFSLRINGTNPEWAQILGDPRIFVPTGSQRPVVVAVRPPQDAPQGDVVDLIVTAASHAEPTIQGNIRVLAVIDTLLEHPDESHLVADIDKSLRKGKQSPGPLVLLPLVLAILRRRCDGPTIVHK